MEKQFNNEDLEKLLRENANQYRMYPSEKVWNGVHAALHTRRKWYRFSALSLLLLSGIAISLLVLNYSTDKAMMTELDKSSVLPASKIFLEKNNSHLSTSELTNTVKEEPAKQIQQIAAERKSIPVEKNSASKELLLPVNTTITDMTEADQPIVQDVQEDLLSELTIPDNTAAEKILSMNDAEKIAADSKVTDIINALASLNIPAAVKTKKTGFSTQFYMTPTVSYRKLTENKSAISSNVVNSYRFVDVNNIVNHKPATGLEFGVEGKYKVSENLSLKSGLQFNINRYDIRAYSSPTEVATISVNNGYRTSTVSSLSNYRNFSGYSPNWLENYYFQAALPLGLEITLAKRKNLSWGVSGTIQPTYVIGDRAYLISSDYKNYAEFPDLMRRWNISSGFETFVSYSTGRIKWQTGPHVRYQHLSSYISDYPVKENLFAVGIKIAATFNKK